MKNGNKGKQNKSLKIAKTRIYFEFLPYSEVRPTRASQARSRADPCRVWAKSRESGLKTVVSHSPINPAIRKLCHIAQNVSEFIPFGNTNEAVFFAEKEPNAAAEYFEIFIAASANRSCRRFDFAEFVTVEFYVTRAIAHEKMLVVRNGVVFAPEFKRAVNYAKQKDRAEYARERAENSHAIRFGIRAESESQQGEQNDCARRNKRANE